MEDLYNIGQRLTDHFISEQPLSNDPELDAWVHANENQEHAYEKYRKIWNESTRIGQSRKFDAISAWQRVNKQVSKGRSIKMGFNKALYLFIGMAASLMIFFAYASYTDMFPARSNTLKFSTNMGSRATVTLPDGSNVVLNAGSNLEYLYNAASREREVIFSGEGLFEVSKSKIPFVIHTSNGLSLKVLGTKFNLKAYSGDILSRTTLLEGKVELVSPTNQELTLNPGQIASYDDMTKNLVYSSGLAYQDFGWVDNKLYMDNLSLEDVCKVLERWYDVRISFDHNVLVEKIHYTGVLKEGTILDVLNALCELSEIKYQIEGKNIIIYNYHKPMTK